MAATSHPRRQYSLSRRLLAVLGLLLILGGIAQPLHRSIEIKSMQQATGTLVSFVEVGKNKCPQVSFEAAGQGQVVVEGKSCTKSSQNEIGDSITVFYDAHHPDQALLDVIHDRWSHAVELFGAGLLCWIFAGCMSTPVGVRSPFVEYITGAWAIPVAFALTASLLLTVGFLMQQHRQGEKDRMTGMAVGTIAATGHGGSKSSRCAMVAFHTPDQVLFEFSASVCSGSNSLGDEVAVRYDPRNPRHAMLDSFLENWFLPLLLWGLGFPFALGVIMLWPSAGERRR